ncbi:MAG: DUF4398 domain-containing protein [Labilithrix sp.]|nr:DUF4398 domain-containing protein [Labilithrix sp.]MCW5809623.1 DUF4398 domain-containing protein [Labilithrix sp.]
MRLSIGALALTALSGCGSVYYAINVNAAEAKLEQAREMGAEKAAPYEYYYAKEHLHEARVHASEASYGDAANLAETAETYAQKAIDKISSGKRGGDDPDKADKDKDESNGWEN